MNNHSRTFNFPVEKIEITGRNLNEFDVKLTCDARDLYGIIDIDGFCSYHGIERKEN